MGAVDSLRQRQSGSLASLAGGRWTPLGARVDRCLVSSAGAQAQNLTRALYVPLPLAAAGSAAPAGLLSLDGQVAAGEMGPSNGVERARARDVISTNQDTIVRDLSATASI